MYTGNSEAHMPSTDDAAERMARLINQAVCGE